MAGIACRSRPDRSRLHGRRRGSKRRSGVVHRCVRSTCCLCTLFRGLFLVLIPLPPAGFRRLSAHPHIAANANTAALLGDRTAEGGAFSETGESLGAEDLEDLRLDFQSVSDMGIGR